MAAPTNRWKLGLFVVASALLGLLAVVFLAQRALHKETVTYTSYFDESVTGLETGSPVNFRGVAVGNISVIDVAPDRRHVEIRYALGVRVLKRLGLSESQGRETKLTIPDALRVQIASTGLTGAKVLQLDFFDAHDTPTPPKLPFPIPEKYIPATPSTMKNLEEAVVKAIDSLPRLTEELGKVLATVELILQDAHARDLPGRTAATLANVNLLVTGLSRTLQDLKLEELSGESRQTLASLNRTLAKAQVTLDHVNGDEGLLASVQRTSDSFGDVAVNTRTLGPELQETVRDLREAAGSFRQLMQALEGDSDMLLKGRARAKK
jgi:paraquat-inducible protein B